MGSWDRSRDLHDQNEFADRGYDPAATPTTEAIRATYATDYYMTDVRGDVTAEERAAAFDRWLAAHDAEVLHRAALFLRGSENPRQSDNTVQAVRHSMDDAGYELLQLSKRVATGEDLVSKLIVERPPDG